MKRIIPLLSSSILIIAGPVQAQDVPPPPVPAPIDEAEQPADAPGEEPAEAPTEPEPEPPAEPAKPAESTPAEPAPTEPSPAPGPVEPAAPAPTEPAPALDPIEPAAPAQVPEQPAPESAVDVNEPESDASGDSEDEEDGGGFYVDGNLALTYGVQSTHGWNDQSQCPESAALGWNPECEPVTVPIGVAPEGRLGVRIHNFGWEGFLLGAFDWSNAKLKTADGEPAIAGLPDYAQDMQIGRAGLGLGTNIRAMSNGWVRFTAGVGGGVMWRWIFTNVSSLDGSSERYVAPIVRGDLSMSIGKFINLGVMGWVEFAPEVKVKPNLEGAVSAAGVESGSTEADALLEQVGSLQDAFGDVTVFDGPQFFVGPFLGIHLGK